MLVCMSSGLGSVEECKEDQPGTGMGKERTGRIKKLCVLFGVCL